MKEPIIIGDKIFKTKNEALLYYKNILNSYKFNETLNKDDFNLILKLLSKHPKANEKIGVGVLSIKVVKTKYDNKRFEITRMDFSVDSFSYRSCIIGEIDNFLKFNNACRNSIQDDMREVKQHYFDENSVKGFVKCQETNILSKWEDLAVDHRQPNTFSVIVDRFKEVFNIDVSIVEFVVDDKNNLIFKDEELIKKFQNYHKEKANLRVVRKECNLSRTGMARLKKTNKDLTIN